MNIVNGRVLLANGEIAETDLGIEDGRIAAVGSTVGGGETLDAAGLLVLPGIVDIHGDAFERQVMPRPGVHVDQDIAFMDTDRQLVGNGITTAYHGITYSWEPGLRGAEQCRTVLDTLDRLQDSFGCDARVHLRWETFNLDAVDEVLEWLGAGRIDLLAFNDHTPMIVREVRGEVKKKIGQYTGRTGLDEKAFVALVDRIVAREADVPAAIDTLAAAARANGVAQLSHDDRTAESRNHFDAIGCKIAEFPMTDEAAARAVALGNPIVLGSPNVMRGGSHNGSLNAADMVRVGRCDILASDYYYPSMMVSAFRLADNGDCSFAEAWSKVSTNPARAAGLTDRGDIAVGQRADLVVVDPDAPGRARAKVTVSAGDIVHRMLM